MRSRVFTVLLTLLALIGTGLAFVHLTQQNLSSLLGKPALSPEQNLFTFQPSEVRQLTIDYQGARHSYREQQGQWLLESHPDPDRADYRALEIFLAFTANLSIIEAIPTSNQNIEQMGLAPVAPEKAHFTLKNNQGHIIASYSMGKKAAWQKLIQKADQESLPPKQRDPPTYWSALYLQPAGSEYIYLCASPFTEDILRNGFSAQRDLRPFFFPPELLGEITITRPNGDIVLAKESPSAEWKITKPFALNADPESTKKLVAGLYNLTATTAENKPAPPAVSPALGISIRFFGMNGQLIDTSSTLWLTKPNQNETQNYLARLNDWRKDIEFTLPRQSSPGILGVDELPLTIEQLQGTSISGLNLKHLQSLEIQSPHLEGPLEIFIGKSPITGEWRAQKNYKNQVTRANEMTFFNVKKILSGEEINPSQTLHEKETKPLTTISRTAEDLSLYGLDQPALILKLKLFDGTHETITFGETIDDNGIPRYFLRRDDSGVIMSLRPDIFPQIASRSYLWRDALVWNFNLIDLSLLQIERIDSDPLTIQYRDLSQTWSARLGDKNVTSLFNENRANRFLEHLEKLTAKRWLGPDHSAARNALRDNSVFTLSVFFKRPDDTEATITSKTLQLARASKTGQGGSLFYYGKVTDDPDYFILDIESVKKLATQLLEDES